jgi:hypothetical protein
VRDQDEATGARARDVGDPVPADRATRAPAQPGQTPSRAARRGAHASTEQLDDLAAGVSRLDRIATAQCESGAGARSVLPVDSATILRVARGPAQVSQTAK